MIPGVTVTPLKTFSDSRGEVKKMLSEHDTQFTKFGEIYFSTVNPGCVKAWHRNKTTTVNYAVIQGKIKLVLYDGTHSQTILLGEDKYNLVTIPPLIWRGFQCISDQKAILADLMDKSYDKADCEKAENLLDCWEQ